MNFFIVSTESSTHAGVIVVDKSYIIEYFLMEFSSASKLQATLIIGYYLDGTSSVQLSRITRLVHHGTRGPRSADIKSRF